jgi:hypothetical protein
MYPGKSTKKIFTVNTSRPKNVKNSLEVVHEFKKVEQGTSTMYAETEK